MSERMESTSLFRDIVRACRASHSVKFADSTGAKLTGVDALTRALVLRRYLRRAVLAADERTAGVFLPPTAAAVVANLALLLDRRVPVSLNYTLNQPIVDASVAKAGIRHVLTSHRFVERIGFLPEATPVYLEDLPANLSPLDKIVGAAQSKLLPENLLLRVLELNAVPSSELMTIVFTSGSTAVPKGVMLSFGNIAANLRQVDHVVHWTDDDVLVGVLPFFHSFGATVTLWAPLTRAIKAVYHTNPLEAQVVGRLTREHGGTILTATPMFLRAYLRRCDPADFATLAVVAVGAEKLPRSLSDAFADKFGIEPIEGYGATEMSPLVAANAPAARYRGDYAAWNKPGTVGRPVPGVRTRVVDPDTGADLPPGEQGLLLLTGPNLMLGYLNDPAGTAKAIRDGWYVTGDIAVVDADGFIHLRDRESRFAKIAGEMVPFAAVEEALHAIVGTDADGLPRAVVTAIPDEVRGERLVVVHTPLAESPTQVVDRLHESGLPNLFVPSHGDFVGVEALPMVGVGKLDLKRIRQIALDALAHPSDRTGAPAAAAGTQP